MACLVNYYVTVNGCEKLKNSLLWLAEFFAGNFYLACDSCAAIGGTPQLVFPRMQPHDEQNNNILSDIVSMKQSVKELDSKIAELLTCMDSIRDELNKTTSLDCDHLLYAAKKLKTDHAMVNIKVARWIPREKMEKVKFLRSRYETLNCTEMPSADGRKPYLVISGQIMKRTTDGKLSLYKDEVTEVVESKKTYSGVPCAPISVVEYSSVGKISTNVTTYSHASDVASSTPKITCGSRLDAIITASCHCVPAQLGIRVGFERSLSSTGSGYL